ncbi:hypothetical protein CupriaWKF_26660 [Cupriavidus sp. WKF15]|uniref:hypothetical protein n=1 Tax=Cupriavidus sp. WKF15 TaxID=3032282 RepID=UPI0023E2BF73|nr:hypothetical protein [Cupriavidus sp. WKF15]WER48371.1 hypothetical protein CupriaWKF_26660 [Cupriavidus sp. WKF15]
MNRILFAFLMAIAILCQSSQAAELRLTGYQGSDGAITTYFGGNSIDPYFATKALLAAKDVGLDADVAARQWIDWLLPRQRSDGRFERYCLKSQRFVACRRADADDAMLATWMETLVRFAPPEGMPAEWKESFDKASRHLDTLRDRQRGVYFIAADLPVALMMDNVEISSAYKAVSKYLQTRHDMEAAAFWMRKATQLDRAILRVFWQPARGYLVSTQARDKIEFYPDTVAQIFPILAGIHPESQSPDASYLAWMQKHRFVWLQNTETDFPWGLVALVADKMGDQDAITCWRARSVQFRHGTHWNVLEEALYQSFEARLTPERALAPVPAGVRCR